MMLTIAKNIQNESEKIRRWEAANPGQTWDDGDYYDYAEPKIYKLRRMIFSKAYQSLSLSAFRTFEALLTERRMRKVKCGNVKKWQVVNNNYLILSYADAKKKFGIPRSSFVKAIDELQAKGFIDITHQGTGGRKTKDGNGDYSMYKLDTRWEDFDEEKGVSRIPPKNPRKKDNRLRGFKIPAVREKARRAKL